MTNQTTTTVTLNSQTRNVEIPTSIMGADIKVDGHSVPSQKIWNAAIDGADNKTLAGMAVDASVFRFEQRAVVVVTDKPTQQHDVVLSAQTYTTPVGLVKHVHVVRRREDMRTRPWMVGTVARLETEPTQEILTILFTTMKTAGRTPIAMVDNKVFFVRTEKVEETLAQFGLTENDVLGNAHILVRLGVIMKRPGGRQDTLLSPSDRFDEETNDGTIMITNEVDGPMAGTLRTESGVYQKGIVRPPLCIDQPDDQVMVEKPTSCEQGQFGKRMPEGEVSCTFVPVRTLPHERCSLNYQTVLFGADDPGAVIRADNKRLERMGIRDMLSKEDADKVDAGVPAALLMRKYAPWKWLTQMECKNGARATVFGSTLVPIGSVRMLPRTYKAFCGDTGWKRFANVVLHRDPALPNSSSMSVYNLEGPIFWDQPLEEQEDCEGIVVNPLDPQWKKAGGDFDGDAAVAFPPAFELTEHVSDGTDSWVVKKKTEAAAYKGKLAPGATIIRTATQFGSKLGSSALCAMRLAEINELSPELRILASKVMQTAVSSKKHNIDEVAGSEGYNTLGLATTVHEPEGGYLLDRIQYVKRARGDANKARAWQDLVQHCAETKPVSAIQKAMFRRVELLNGIFKQTEWLRGSRAQLPETMRLNALAWMLEEDDPVEQTELVRQLATTYRQVVRAGAEATDDDVKRRASDVAEGIKVQIRLHMHQGTLSEAALVAYGPHAMAAELVSVETFKELGAAVRFAELTLHGMNIVDGEYRVAELDTIPSSTKAAITIADAGVEFVDVKVVRNNRNSQTVVLTW